MMASKNSTFLISLAIILSSLLLLNGCATSASDKFKGKTSAQIYAMGKTRLLEGQYDEAIGAFDALEARYPYGRDSELSQLAVMFAYYKKNEYPQSIASADRFIRMYPRHQYVDYAYYMKGLAHYDDYFSFVFRALKLDRAIRDTEEGRESFHAFKTLIENYPNSCYASDAHKRMIYLKDHLARNELSVAQYYYDRAAYLAAANRGAYILHNFPDTKAVPCALKIMHDAYCKLGMRDLAAKAQATLDANKCM